MVEEWSKTDWQNCAYDHCRRRGVGRGGYPDARTVVYGGIHIDADHIGRGLFIYPTRARALGLVRHRHVSDLHLQHNHRLYGRLFKSRSGWRDQSTRIYDHSGIPVAAPARGNMSFYEGRCRFDGHLIGGIYQLATICAYGGGCNAE